MTSRQRGEVNGRAANDLFVGTRSPASRQEGRCGVEKLWGDRPPLLTLFLREELGIVSVIVSDHRPAIGTYR